MLAKFTSLYVCRTYLCSIGVSAEVATSLLRCICACSIGVSVDLKRAFDTVNHDLLIDKLEYYEIRGIAQEWLKSDLKDRKQFVQIYECASTLLRVTCGVPQGSILGPKLFILYISDICNASTSLKLILFANDTNVFYSGVHILTMCVYIYEQ